MFYCKRCQEKNSWPEGLGRSYGRCEVCGKTAECYDVASKYLPVPGELLGEYIETLPKEET